MPILFRWIANALALMLIAALVNGFQVSGLYAALIGSLVLGLVNALVRPLVLILTLPVNILTLGLFTFIINAGMLWLTSTIVKGFELSGFLPALYSAVLLWIASMGIDWVVEGSRGKR